MVAFGTAADIEKGSVIQMPEMTQNGIRINDPEAPASYAQVALMVELAKAGVLSEEEIDAFGTNPTKQAASELIISHAHEDGFKAVQEARRAARTAERAETAAQQAGTRRSFAHVKIPAEFVHPYTYTAKDGRTFDKAYVHIPQGTKVNGIDVGGFSTDVFMSDRMKQQMLAGENPTLSFAGDEMVTIWTGKKDDPEHPYERFEVNPYDLCHGIKVNNDQYKANRAAEREAAKEQGVSLKGMERDSREAAEALASRDSQESGVQSR